MSADGRTPVGVLISGRGSNMLALAAASEAGAPYRVACVISNAPDAVGLERARAQGIPAFAVDHRTFGKDRAAFEGAVIDILAAHQVSHVALAGFMRVLTPRFIAAYPGRLINIHPSLLPLFAGLNTHQRALDAGMTLVGCTVHHVTEGVDEGPIIGQAAIAIRPQDTAESLAARLIAVEHALYPACLAQVTSGQAQAPPQVEGALFSLRAP